MRGDYEEAALHLDDVSARFEALDAEHELAGAAGHTAIQQRAQETASRLHRGLGRAAPSVVRAARRRVRNETPLGAALSGRRSRRLRESLVGVA